MYIGRADQFFNKRLHIRWLSFKSKSILYKRLKNYFGVQFQVFTFRFAQILRTTQSAGVFILNMNISILPDDFISYHNIVSCEKWMKQVLKLFWITQTGYLWDTSVILWYLCRTENKQNRNNQIQLTYSDLVLNLHYRISSLSNKLLFVLFSFSMWQISVGKQTFC